MVSSSHPDPEPARASSFPLTKWTLLFGVRGGDEEKARAVLDEVFTVYWPSLYAFVRRKGYGAEDAKDLTQEFVLGLMQGDFLEGLDPSRGKFRAFLLACLKHFLSNERRRRNSLKRGGGRRFFALAAAETERRLAGYPAHELTPEHLFEREWARALLGRATARFREHCDARGVGKSFDALWAAVCAQDDAPSYAELGLALERTEGAVKVLVHRLRRRFGELLREEIGQTVSSPAEVEEELRTLFDAVSSPRSAD